MNVTESQLSQWIAEMDADPSHNYGETFYDVCKFAASAARQASALQARVEELHGQIMHINSGDNRSIDYKIGHRDARHAAAELAAAALGEDRK
jgi:hypothetical protein